MYFECQNIAVEKIRIVEFDNQSTCITLGEGINKGDNYWDYGSGVLVLGYKVHYRRNCNLEFTA